MKGHDNFQNGQKFIDVGGYKGLQEEVIPSGSWNLNPWFVKVKQVELTDIPVGTVGVVISPVGKTPTNQFGIVDEGYKGVCNKPYAPGKYPINTDVMEVVIIPTLPIALDWSNKAKSPTNYDAPLHALNLRSRDGFAFNIEVTQVIRVAEKDAPEMIYRVGSMFGGLERDSKKSDSIKALVIKVLQPAVSNYFRNSAQNYEVMDFLENRSERQREAKDHIKSALSDYAVQAVDTLIDEIELPKELEKALTDRQIAQEQSKTYEAQKLSENEREKLARAQAIADSQADLVKHENDVEFAKKDAAANIERSKGEAESRRVIGQADADVLQSGAIALGTSNYTALIITRTAAENNRDLIPQVVVNNGSSSNTGGLIDAWIGTTLNNQVSQQRFVEQSSNLPLSELLETSPVVPIKSNGSPPSPALSQSYTVCTDCKNKNPSAHNFCFKCGNPLANQGKR